MELSLDDGTLFLVSFENVYNVHITFSTSTLYFGAQDSLLLLNNYLIKYVENLDLSIHTD